jgi:hypothetical protein
VPVGPGETINYSLALTVQKPGPFLANIPLDVFDGDYRKIQFTVRGRAVNEDRTNAKRDP